MKPMTLPIVSAVIITVFGGPSYSPRARAQPDPGDTNSWCTNCPPYTNEWANPSYPSNALQWAILNGTNFGLFNTINHRSYQIQSSTNLLDWSLFGPAFIASTNNQTIDYTNSYSHEFFRAQDISVIESRQVFAQESFTTCFGNHIGYAPYLNDATNQTWFLIDTNKPIHTISDGTGRPDTGIEYVGSFGDLGCGFGSVTITNPFSSKYRFSFYFLSNLPDTNVLYPAVLDGFQP